MFSTTSQVSGLGCTEIVTLRHFPDDQLALTAFKGRSFEAELNHPSLELFRPATANLYFF